ncbi:MAG TPA: DUF5615 family PIN-like protein [Vineibacter sp.]|nr:DUF5615 family PIN-like protein [Vineibacter sp.]
MIRFLVDENLSPALPPIAHAAGHEARHVNHLGLRTTRDWTLLRFAIERAWTLVTNNAIEFLTRYAATVLHPGVVFLVPSLPRASQIALFQAVLGHVRSLESLVNQAIDVDLGPDNSILVRRYSLP